MILGRRITMRPQEIKDISNNYYSWIKANHKFIQLENDSLEFYSPILDYFGDSISVNISTIEDRYYLSDFGETLWNMEIAGINLTNDKQSKRYQLFEGIIEYEGLLFDETKQEIYKLTTKSNLPQSIHDFVSTLAKVSNLAITKKEKTISLFRDEVMHYFLENRDTLYPQVFPDVSVQGRSKLIHKFDLTFPGKRTEYIKIIKSINQSNAKNIIFDWQDVEDYRNPTYNTDSRLNIIHQGLETVSPSVSTMLKEYGIELFAFDNKHEIETKFGKVATNY